MCHKPPKNAGLTNLDFPIYDHERKILGWESIITKEEIHQALIEMNSQHLNQAQDTPFGHGEGYNLLHDDATR